MGHQRLQVLGIGVAKGDVAALVARDLAAFTAVEVVLAGLKLQKLPGLGNLDAFGDGFMGLHRNS